MHLTSNYAKLQAKAPTVEQIAAYKKKRQMRLSNKELALLDEHKAELRHRRQHGKNVASKRPHPEREPGPVIVSRRGLCTE